MYWLKLTANTLKHLKHLLFLSILFSIVFFISCGKDETSPEPTDYSVSVTLNPTDGGSVSPNGGQFVEGESISFSVTPSENYQFKNWSGSNSSSDNPLKLTIDGDKVLTVNFEKKDTDGDGVTDDLDTCADTAEGTTVDENGCADSQKDTDGDGVSDDLDTCADTPEGTTVDENGCAVTFLYLDENSITIKATEYAVVGESYELDSVSYLVVDNGLLYQMITDENDITKVVTSNVTYMRGMFYTLTNSVFNQDISSWDVSNVTDMIGTFHYAASFNQDISSWDVSNVTDMLQMFYGAEAFNQDISSWDVDNVTNCALFSTDATAWTEPKPNFANCEE